MNQSQKDTICAEHNICRCCMDPLNHMLACTAFLKQGTQNLQPTSKLFGPTNLMADTGTIPRVRSL